MKFERMILSSNRRNKVVNRTSNEAMYYPYHTRLHTSTLGRYLQYTNPALGRFREASSFLIPRNLKRAKPCEQVPTPTVRLFNVKIHLS